MIHRTRRAAVVALLAAAVALLAAGCSGGGGGAAKSAALPPAVTSRGATEAARACRMWGETRADAKATAKAPDYAVLTAMASAITPVANQAATDDPKWSQLSLDIGAGIDFHHAALPDIVSRLDNDCKAVPGAAVKAAASEPEPYSSTTVAPSGPTTTP